jgi:hypothetical protein
VPPVTYTARQEIVAKVICRKLSDEFGSVKNIEPRSLVRAFWIPSPTVKYSIGIMIYVPIASRKKIYHTKGDLLQGVRNWAF